MRRNFSAGTPTSSSASAPHASDCGNSETRLKNASIRGTDPWENYEPSGSDFLRHPLSDLRQQTTTPLWIPSLLTRCKAGFQLALRKDMGHKIVKKPLHTGARRLGRAEQGFVPRFIATIGNGFHRFFSKCCRGVTTSGREK